MLIFSFTGLLNVVFDHQIISRLLAQPNDIFNVRNNHFKLCGLYFYTFCNDLLVLPLHAYVDGGGISYGILRRVEPTAISPPECWVPAAAIVRVKMRLVLLDIEISV